MKKIGLVLLGFGMMLAIAGLLRHHPEEPHSVTLTWKAPATREKVTIVGYNVYRKPEDSTSFSRIAERVAGPPYEDRLVTSGRRYLYVVTSVDQNGRESRYSAAVTVEVP
jgi:fibronectin type 3 domain-containing protein